MTVIPDSQYAAAPTEIPHSLCCPITEYRKLLKGGRIVEEAGGNPRQLPLDLLLAPETF